MTVEVVYVPDDENCAADRLSRWRHKGFLGLPGRAGEVLIICGCFGLVPTDAQAMLLDHAYPHHSSVVLAVRASPTTAEVWGWGLAAVEWRPGEVWNLWVFSTRTAANPLL